MKRFFVVFETRQDGAIGEFSHSGEMVTMHQSSFSEMEVIREAMRQLHAKGLETRFPIRVTKLSLSDLILHEALNEVTA
jgi:hypothetical protein